MALRKQLPWQPQQHLTNAFFFLLNLSFATCITFSNPRSKENTMNSKFYRILRIFKNTIFALFCLPSIVKYHTHQNLLPFLRQNTWSDLAFSAWVCFCSWVFPCSKPHQYYNCQSTKYLSLTQKCQYYRVSVLAVDINCILHNKMKAISKITELGANFVWHLK